MFVGVGVCGNNVCVLASVCVCVLNKPAAAAKKPQKANWNGRLGPGAVTQLCVSGSKIHLHYTYTYMDVYFIYTLEDHTHLSWTKIHMKCAYLYI